MNRKPSLRRFLEGWDGGKQNLSSAEFLKTNGYCIPTETCGSLKFCKDSGTK
jgi:hypothetical protein